MERIKELRAILGDEDRLFGLIKEELLETREIYGDERRTDIVPAEGEIDLEDLIAEEQMVVSITSPGYIKRLPLSTYRKQKRGGVGVIGMEIKEEDYIQHLRIFSTHDFLLFFTNRGKVYRLKVYELPEGARTAKGRAHRQPAAFAGGRDGARRHRHARLQREQVPRLRHPQGPDQEDRAACLQHADPRRRHHRDQAARRRRAGGGARHRAATTTSSWSPSSGYAARFNESRVRPMGRDTSGVKGMNVAEKGNEVLEMDVARDDAELFVVTENGFGKRTAIPEYPVKGRGTKGVKTIQLTDRKGKLAGALVVKEHQELLFISQSGMVQRTGVRGISKMGRSTQGVKVMNVRDDDVSAVALVVESERRRRSGR